MRKLESTKFKDKTAAVLCSESTPPMFLTANELVALTHRLRFTAQSKYLSNVGISHKIRPDGSVCVLRAHVELEMGFSTQKLKQPKTITPNFDFLTGAK